jgi:hypothetical protein
VYHRASAYRPRAAEVRKAEREYSVSSEDLKASQVNHPLRVCEIKVRRPLQECENLLLPRKRRDATFYRTLTHEFHRQNRM